MGIVTNGFIFIAFLQSFGNLWFLFLGGFFVLIIFLNIMYKSRYRNLSPSFNRAKESLYKGMTKAEVLEAFKLFTPKHRGNTLIYKLRSATNQHYELHLMFDENDKLYDYESSKTTYRYN